MLEIKPNTHVRVKTRPDLGAGEVIRIAGEGSEAQVDVVFDRDDGRKLETFPLSWLEAEENFWSRLASSRFDASEDFLLKQLAHQFPLENTGGELSNSRTDLLPHQILLTHDVVASPRRRFLIADEVGLGKTIEAGMIIRELVARGEAERILIVCPAGLTKNWQRELQDCFRLAFEVYAYDFSGNGLAVWENHHRVIASIDTIKKSELLDQILRAPRWDVAIFDEAHHLTRKRYGRKVQATQNYRLAEMLRDHTRDLLYLSATPHQGDAFQFWSLIQLLDDQLFENPESLQDHRGLLNRVIIRRTKREVTDAQGNPIFMRRYVHTQTFPLAAREREFYDRLTDYLRQGYGAAGIDQSKTTSQQRAVGFVMATFQKIMSSSPRAIRQALRRRLMVLLARQQMALESGKSGPATSQDVASRILKLQDELRELAIQTEGILFSESQRAEADSYIAKLKARLSKKGAGQEEMTYWNLDAEENGEGLIYAEETIPGEAQKVRELIKLVPAGTDRKFDTLIRAIEDLRRMEANEKFVIFTQYRETLFFLEEELGKLYGQERIATVKGGALDEKIAAVEKFWKPEIAQFLLSTSAGGEGINLQCARILFNYDLPWNPMAVEQRIGRIHRYGQQDTAQVYNLVAEDTVEEKVYAILEQKLLEIARAIGKVDEITGEVVEDFRSEILGFLGSSPNYQKLYQKALLDPDYSRTAREISQAIRRAQEASEALRQLTQDLHAFNLEAYISLQGRYTLRDLEKYCLFAIPKLGGAILPETPGFYRVHTPKALLNSRGVAREYERMTFDRKLAMRTKGSQLLGIGHPLIDALLEYFRDTARTGEVGCFVTSQESPKRCMARYIFTLTFQDGSIRRYYENFVLDENGVFASLVDRFDIDRLDENLALTLAFRVDESILRHWQEEAESIQRTYEARLRAELDNLLSIRAKLVGVNVF